MNQLENYLHLDVRFLGHTNDIFEITSDNHGQVIAGIVSEDQFNYLYNEDAIKYEDRFLEIKRIIGTEGDLKVMTARAKKRSVKNVCLVIKLNSKVQYFQDAVHYIHKILKDYHAQF